MAAYCRVCDWNRLWAGCRKSGITSCSTAYIKRGTMLYLSLVIQYCALISDKSQLFGVCHACCCRCCCCCCCKSTDSLCLLLFEATEADVYPELLFLGTGSAMPNKVRNVSAIWLNLRYASYVSWSYLDGLDFFEWVFFCSLIVLCLAIRMHIIFIFDVHVHCPFCYCYIIKCI